MLLRAPHCKHPRQIFDHQKLHSSVCLHKEDFPKDPFAFLPDSWINEEYGWAEVINLLRDKEEAMKDRAASASRSGTMDLPPPGFPSNPDPSPSPSIASKNRKIFRSAIRRVGSRSSSIVSRASSIDRQSYDQTDLTSNSDMSDDQSGIVQNSPPLTKPVEAITEPTDEPVPPDVTGAGNILAEFTLPAGAIELDLLDSDAIPALIAGVLRGTNVAEFLERLEVLAYTGTHSDLYLLSIFIYENILDIGKEIIRQNNRLQFSSMLLQVCSDRKYAEYTGLAIRVAYEVFWHAGKRLPFLV